MSYLVGRKKTKEQIANAFGISMSMLTTDAVNLANAKAGNYQHAKNAILPRCRRFEEKLYQLYSSGITGGPAWTHRALGEEVTPIAICANLRKDDYILDAAGGGTDLAAGDFFFRENAYGTAAAAAVTYANCQEINGINNLVSDGSTTINGVSEGWDNYKTIWGLDRTSYWYLQSLIKDFSDARLDEENMTAMMMDLQFSRQAQPNLLLTTPKAENKYFLEKKDDRRFNNVGPMNFVGGYTRMGVQLGEYQLILTSLGACPQNTLFVINTDDFAFCQNSPIEWVLGDGGQVLVQSHTGDNKFATAVQYVNFVCFDSYRQAKGHSILQT